MEGRTSRAERRGAQQLLLILSRRAARSNPNEPKNFREIGDGAVVAEISKHRLFPATERQGIGRRSSAAFLERRRTTAAAGGGIRRRIPLGDLQRSPDEQDCPGAEADRHGGADNVGWRRLAPHAAHDQGERQAQRPGRQGREQHDPGQDCQQRRTTRLVAPPAREERRSARDPFRREGGHEGQHPEYRQGFGATLLLGRRMLIGNGTRWRRATAFFLGA